MKINKLNNEFFYDFASWVLGVDVELYKHDLILERANDKIKLKVFLGGEMEDGRKLLFKDEKCVFKHCGCFNCESKDISVQWIKYLLEYADELTDEDKQEIVDKYNENIEKDINNYASKRRQSLIS